MDLKRTAERLLKGDVKGAFDDYSNQLERNIGLTGVIIISLSAMLGPALFVLPSLSAEIMGDGMWLAFVLAAIVVVPAALSKSELASAMPSSGGTYIYIERTYGPLFGTIAGLGLWSSFLLKAAFSLIGFTAYLAIVTAYLDVDVEITTVSLWALFIIVIINILGAKKVKAIQAPILGAAILLLLWISVVAAFDPETDMSRPFKAAFETDVWTIAETTAFVFVAYAGVTKVAAIAGEVVEPSKNLPRGMFLSLLIATVLYAWICYVLMASLESGWYMEDGVVREDPIGIFAEKFMGSKVALLAAALGILTMASMALAGVLGSSRFLFAMARDNLLPQQLEEMNSRYETPHWPIILTGLLMALVIIYLPVKDVAKLASGFKIMIFMVVNSCVIILRYKSSKIEWYKPEYRSPMYPWVQWFGIIAGVWLIAMMGTKAYTGAGVAVLAGILTYLSYGRKHTKSRVTPFQTFREQFMNPSQTEMERRKVAFDAADWNTCVEVFEDIPTSTVITPVGLLNALVTADTKVCVEVSLDLPMKTSNVSVCTLNRGNHS